MIGQTISHYNILEKLGEGGMGVVYKAHDTKLDRDVALKFLPAHLAASEQDKARFVQEAKAAAALNHPNVCSIIDIQEHEASDGGRGTPDAIKQMFIVMEFVDGQTLRERSAGQAPGSTISLKQSIDIGIQVADGLAAAHEKGIVHRDIKPENVMIRRDGIAQVMDFGLAKLRASSSKITRLTRQGSTVGTAGYMSPEQVTGQEADHRSDIFSLGVLLYELFTGALPFKGVHETALAYEIVNVDPAPMSAAKPSLDGALDAIVLECLAKEPSERFQSVAEVAKELRRFKRESSRQSVSRISAVRTAPRVSTPGYGPDDPAVAATAGGPRRSSILPWAIAAVFFVATALLAWMKFSTVPAVPDEVRLSINPPEKTSFRFVAGSVAAISPDGKLVTFFATDSTASTALYVRALRDESARKLSGTEDAYLPFWSPDSRSIAFFSRGKLKRIDVDGGSPLTICDLRLGRGGSWNDAGVIIFAGEQNAGLSMVRATGGEVTALTALDTAKQERAHRWPFFLPDGEHYLFLARTTMMVGSTDTANLYIGTIGSPDRTLLLTGATNVEFGGGHLFYLRERTLMAHRLDPERLELSGDPFTVAENVMVSQGLIKGAFSASRSGDVVFYAGTDVGGYIVKWFDRAGRELGTIGERGRSTTLKLSPDGNKLAIEENDESGTNRDIWIHDLRRGFKSRLTFDPKNDLIPLWTPDGKQIIFTSNRDGIQNFYRKNAEGIGIDELLFKSGVAKRAVSISGDGGTLFFFQKNPEMRDDLYALPLGGGDRQPVPVVKDDFDKDYPMVSHDGKWVAYTSNETGTYQLYVVPYPPTGARWQISQEHAVFPVWSRNGKALYYTTTEGKLMMTHLEVKGGVLEPGDTETLFTADIRFSESPFDVTADGSRIVAIVADNPDETQPLTVVLNGLRAEGQR